MKILQVHSPYRFLGGEDTVVANEARLLRSSGHEVWQFLEPNPQSSAAAAAATAAAPWNLLSASQIRARLRAETPEVAHVHNTWFRLSPAVYRELARAHVPIVRTLHNYRSFCLQGQAFRDGHACTTCLSAPFTGVRDGCYRSRPMSLVAGITQLSATLADRSVDAFVTPSEHVRSLVVRGGVPMERTIVKPHFTFDPGPRPTAPSESDTVLFVGRLVPEKGADLLLEAWRRLRRGSGLHLEVIGSGPLREDLAGSATSTVGFNTMTHHEVLQRMLRARAIVVPSMFHEPFGLVVLEGMATGMPVAGFRSGAIGEVLGDGDTLLVAPGDLDALVDVLEKLSDDALVDALGAHNRAGYLSRFSPEAQLPLLEAVYRDAKDRHGIL